MSRLQERRREFKKEEEKQGRGTVGQKWTQRRRLVWEGEKAFSPSECAI